MGVVECWRIRRKLSLYSGRSGIFEKEQVVGLELLRQARGLHRPELLVHVVEQFHFLAERRAQVREELGNNAQIRPRLEEFGVRQVGLLGDAAGDLFRFLLLGRAVRSLQSGNRHLRANTFEAALHGPPHGVFDLGKIVTGGVGVGKRSLRACVRPAIDRQACRRACP